MPTTEPAGSWNQEKTTMKINVNNTAKLAAELADVQKRESARTIELGDITAEVARIEADLAKLLNKKDWVGVVVSIDLHAQAFPGAYKGAPESTHFTLERGASAWFVTSLSRRYTRTSRNNELRLLDSHKAAMVEFVLKNF